MNQKWMSYLVILTTAAMIVINILANALPLNGLNTGEISDQFDVYFVPAGYVFSIWLLIYIGLVAFSVAQALPDGLSNTRFSAVRGWVILGNIANSIWIFLWHYEQFPVTLLAMFTLLVSLIVTFLRLEIGRANVSTTEKWAAHIPFSIYLGWITVATVANITSVLDYLQWNRLGLSEITWMWIILAAVLIIAGLMALTRRQIPYTMVILWALAGIALKHAATGPVAMAAWVTFALVLLTLVAAYFRPALARQHAG